MTTGTPATYSDEDAERIGFIANELATAAGLSYEDAQEYVVRVRESLNPGQG